MISLLLVLACVSGPPATGDGVSGEVAEGDADATGCEAIDDDQDGADACDDCDDGDPLAFPGAVERCNGLDDDCDDALGLAEQVDEDGDGIGDCVACEQAGFHAGTLGLGGSALVDALHELTSDQDCANYSAETEFMFLDLDHESDGTVECVYTGRRVAVGTEKPDENDMNTEHTWPQSLGAENEPAKCDLHHLFPSDSAANGARAAMPFGEVSTVEQWWDVTGESAEGSSSWEPRDVHKGNVARAMLYFAMRYGHPVDSSELALYRSWHAADPADATERTRTLEIRDRQGEANPYVVCPELVEQL